MGLLRDHTPTNQRMILLYFIELVIQVYQALSTVPNRCSGRGECGWRSRVSGNGTSALMSLYSFLKFYHKVRAGEHQVLKKKKKKTPVNPTQLV